MKLLDRYVLFSFLRNYIIALMVLVGLYVVLDMVFAFDELAKVGRQGGEEAAGSGWVVVRHILNYYSYRVFLIFSLLSGIIPVVAAAFTIIRLTRFNEMVATLAAGVPLLRIAMPIIVAAMISNVLLIIDQELIIPRIIPMLVREHDELDPSDKSYPISALKDGPDRLLVAAAYFPPGEGKPARIEQLSVIEHDADFRPVSLLTADEATWDDQRQAWALINGRRVDNVAADQIPSAPQPQTDYVTRVTPDEIALYRSGDYVNLLPTSRIRELLKRRTGYGTVDLHRVLHTRYTQWALNLLLLLLAMGTLLSRDPNQIKLGIMQCVAVTGACMGMIFLSQQLAGTPPPNPTWIDHWPAIMAWLPILIFGPMAIWLLDRVKT